MSVGPLLFQYEGNGEFRATSGYWAGKADKAYVVGDIYALVEHNDRSQASHNHEFARISELFDSLPEQFAHEPWAQTAEHLRKYALIKCRYCDTQTYACGSKAEAERWAKNLRPKDEYSIVMFEGTTVFVFTAQSQSRRAMGKQRFEESKAAVIGFLEDLIGVEPEARAA